MATPEIEATCNDCGQQMAEGCVPAGIDKPYCPTCYSDDLEFHRPSEDS